MPLTRPRIPDECPRAATVRVGEQGPVGNLLYGGRPGEGLPGPAGVPLEGRPSIAELENLTAKHGVEFGVTYKLGAVLAPMVLAVSISYTPGVTDPWICHLGQTY